MIGFEQASRFAELVGRVFGEEAGLVPPGIVLELDRDEWRLHKREGIWLIRFGIAAGGVGTRSGVGIHNATSDSLIVVTFIKADTAPLQLRRPTLDPLPANYVEGAPVTSGARDSRAPVSRFHIMTKSVGAATIISPMHQFDNAGERLSYAENGLSWVLSPLSNLILESTVDNTAVTVTIGGYERPARFEELAI